MATLSWPSKDPDETLDYVIEWADRLPVTDTITESLWTIPDGLTSTYDEIVEGEQKTSVWLAGGEIGSIYSITNTISTTEGRTLQQTVRIKIKAR